MAAAVHPRRKPPPMAGVSTAAGQRWLPRKRYRRWTYRLAYLMMWILCGAAAAIVWLEPRLLLATALAVVAGGLALRWRAAVNAAAAASAAKAPPAKPKWTMPVPRARHLVSRDGVRLKYYVIPGRTKDVMVFAAGLSCASTFHLWAAPLVYAFGDRYTYLYWEYRGLFESDRPHRSRRLAIPEHAEDLREILRAEQLSRIDVLVGHSMGCQVALEYTALYPEMVEKLVLSNGGHGRICSSFLQPFIRVPGMRQVYFALTRLALALVGPIDDQKVNRIADSWPFWLLRRTVRAVFQGYASVFGSPLLREVIGPTYLEDFFESYVVEALRSGAHVDTLSRLIWELEAHSVYHILPDIRQPVLILTGVFDPVIPAYQGFEIAELLPNVHHCWIPTSAHVAFLDAPEVAVREVERFVNQHTPGLRYERRQSTFL